MVGTLIRLDYLRCTFIWIQFVFIKQFGIRENMNTDNALDNFMTNVCKGLNLNKYITSLFIGIKKAFGPVD